MDFLYRLRTQSMVRTYKEISDAYKTCQKPWQASVEIQYFYLDKDFVYNDRNYYRKKVVWLNDWVSKLIDENLSKFHKFKKDPFNIEEKIFNKERIRDEV